MADCKARIVVQAANIRQQPRAASDVSIVGIAHRGDELPVQDVQQPEGDRFRWFQITLPENNMPGWIREDLVQLSGDCAAFGVASVSPPLQPMDDIPTEEEAEDEEPVDPSPTAPTEDELLSVLEGDCRARVSVFLGRVRAEPTTNSATIGMLPLNATFTVLDISEEDADGFHWYALEHDGQKAWMRENILEVTGDCLDMRAHIPAEDETDEPAEPPVSEGSCVAALTVGRANVRPQPNTQQAPLGMADRGETFPVVEVTARQPDGFRWVKINFNGQDGFLRKDLVALEGDCAALIPAEDPADLPEITIGERLPSPVSVRVGRGFRQQGHPGLDFPIGTGALLRVAIAGQVVRAHHCPNCEGDPPNIDPRNLSNEELQEVFSDPDWGFGYGHHVIVAHAFDDLPVEVRQRLFERGAREDDRLFVLYAHLSRMDVENSQRLAAGDSIGLTGNTGNSTGSHLHLETAFGTRWFGARKVHPADVFDVERKFA